jgi:EmrB/QacA subfamily drug resistance transporter
MSGFFHQPCDEAAARANLSAAPCARKNAPWVLAATILGSSMAFIDGTVVNIALPALQTDLHATLVDVQWVIEAYALLLAAFILTGGSLGDQLGRRRIFLAGTIIFALASLGCALAATVGQLVAARAIQGLGGALLVPGSLSILASSFSEKDRGRAIGTWSGFTSITAAVGPVLGGWLIDHLSWRAAFLINLPIACAVVVISLCFIPESRGEQGGAKLDWPGALLAAVGLGGVVYALLESSILGWRHPRIWGALVLGVAASISFMAVERRAADPMLPLALFRSRTFAGANLLTLFLYTALTGVLFFFPLDLIQVQGYTATAAGAALLPFILLMFFLSRWSGTLFDRFGGRGPLIIGCSIAALGFALFAVPGIGGSYLTTFLLPILVLGLGMATSVAPLTTAVMSAVPSKHAGAASGINNAVSRVAGLMAVAVFSIVMLRIFEPRLDEGLSRASLPAAAQAEIRGQSSRLGAAQLPKDLTASERASAERVIGSAFVAGFRAVALISAGLALLAAMTGGRMIGEKNRRAN